ncbi:MAG: hypothetical protein HY673_14215 [Chloroflexi bacterium]|nr:hypothetical protein [Chloroflexota bacterium]
MPSTIAASMALTMKARHRQRKRAYAPGYVSLEDLRLIWREGHKNKPKNTQTIDVMREALLEHYQSPEGMAEIKAAPIWLREKPITEIVDLLLKDMVDWDESGFPKKDPRGKPFRTG